MWDNSVTTNYFLKHTRCITHFNDPDMVKDVLAIGTERKIFIGQEGMTLSNLLDLCSFIKTKEGQEEITKIQRRKKLERKAKEKNMSVHDFALVRAFNQQMQEYSKGTKRTREEEEKKMEGLRKHQMAAQEAQSERKLNEKKMKVAIKKEQ
ncbi:hypothetical protein Tsubulata_017960 [Turnera subulata]|uniref:Uncharacterized protein n=1 Tax=Turnera subulata TaxID=218843 RepID=A0A9Q0GGU6_9ROSI|nr:hypothetical protein Tsubulata_017960 [Turnera subulata]